MWSSLETALRSSKKTQVIPQPGGQVCRVPWMAKCHSFFCSVSSEPQQPLLSLANRWISFDIWWIWLVLAVWNYFNFMLSFLGCFIPPIKLMHCVKGLEIHTKPWKFMLHLIAFTFSCPTHCKTDRWKAKVPLLLYWWVLEWFNMYDLRCSPLCWCQSWCRIECPSPIGVWLSSVLLWWMQMSASNSPCSCPYL